MDSSATKIAISVVTPCRNEADAVHNFLVSVLGQQNVPGEWEIIAADGMSTDGTRQILERICREHSRVQVVDNPELTVSCGLNKAIRAARGEIIIRMDAHTEYAPDYIYQCAKTLRGTNATCVGGPARTLPGRRYIESAIEAAYHSPFACGSARFHQVDYEGYVDTVTYGCWRKADLERLGLFDESLVRNQDDELSLRTIRSGETIWQTPAIVSWYRPRSTLRQLFRQYFQYGFWKVAVIRKHRVPARWGHLIPGAFVGGNALAVIICLLLLTLSGSKAALMPALAWAGVLILYGIAAILAAVRTASSHDWSLMPVLPLVFFVFHTSYGLGFLIAVLANVAYPDRRLMTAATQLSR